MDFGIFLWKRQLFGLSLIVLVTFFLSEIVIFLLSKEPFVVVSQILFIIIVLVALIYPERSTIINSFIGMGFLVFYALLTSPEFSGLVPAMIQFYVFISISIFLSAIISDIRYNEKKYYSLLENTTRGICIYDFEKGAVVEKSPSFKYDPDLLLDNTRDTIQQIFESDPGGVDNTAGFELEYESPDGEKNELLILAERLFGKYIMLIVTDITRRKMAEENSQIVSALSHALLRGSNIEASSSFTSYAAINISDTSGVGIYLMDDKKKGFQLFSSRNLPKKYEDDFSLIDQSCRMGQIIAEGETEETVTGEIGVFFDDDVESHLERSVLVVPVYLTNKPVGCIFAVSEKGKKFSESSKNSFESIAHIFGSALKRIRAENEILSIKTNLESLFESLDDFIFVSDMEGKILHTNSIVSRKLGYTPRELEMMNISGIHGHQSYDSFSNEIEGLISGRKDSLSFDLVKSGGDLIPVEMKAVMGKWKESEAVFVIDRDVTVRKKHEDEIRSRDAILDAVSIIAENFLRADKWEDNIYESLERLGKASGVASVSLFETKRVLEGSFTPDKIYKWVNEKYRFIPEMESFSKLSLFDEWPGKSHYSREGENIIFMDLLSLSEDDRRIFERLKIETILAVPLVVDGSFRGFMCLVEGRKRIWSATETEAIMIAGDIISSAIKRTETDEIFRNPIERSLVGVFLIQDHILSYVNPKFAEMIGYSREELIGKVNIIDLVHPDFRHMIYDETKRIESLFVDKIDEKLPDFHFEVIGVRKDGSLIDVEVYGSYMFHRGGLSFIGMAVDITSRKEAERKLYESTERLDLALKSTKLGIFDWNIRDDKLSYNDALFTMLGYTPEDYEEGRMSFGHILHPDDREEKERRLNDHLDGRTPGYEAEYRMKAKSGEWRWISVKGEVVERDSSGKAVRITGTHLDITERKNSDEKIRHLNKVLKAVRNVNELIVRETDIEKLIKGASEMLVETRGYLDAWVILTDSYGSYLDSSGSGDREDIGEIIRNTKSGNPPQVLINALRTSEIISLSELNGPEISGDAREIKGELLCRRLQYGDDIFGVIIISIPVGLSDDKDELALFNELASDISFAIHDIILQKERKNYEEEILKSLEEKTVLLQEVHHRVKNNLQIISGLIKMQSRSIADVSARDSLLRCENRIMALAMVHEALYRSDNLSEISAGEHFINLAQILVDSLAFSEFKDISLKTDVKRVNLPINVAIPCSLIINEVISNSIKYAFAGRDSGELSLIFRIEGDHYRLEISDDGVGVPEDFDLEKSKSLGMRLIRRLALEQLRGTIEIRTGEGTSFIFMFPIHPD
ncbi:MAG: PAS domain S-box protein [Methanomicrobiaceae archaeon]|nr:PAS domain S-box protein [Methanomicrobiaceae archaeon]